MKHYDLIIIGGGGGTKLRPAADLGKKVAIIEKEDLGGTCLNRGCIPSKMLIYPADLVTHWREDRDKFFIKSDSNIDLDWEALVKRTTETVVADSESIGPSYEKNSNIDLYRGHARFVEGKTVEVNGEKLTADKIYIATGTRPSVPNIPGLKGTPFMTSREALRNTTQPKRMIVIGGGYIAVELGHFYGAMGTQVDFLVRSSMVKAEDKDIREQFEQNFSSRYNVHFGATPTAVEYKEDTFYVTTKNKEGVETVMEGRYLFRHSVNFEGEYLMGQHYEGAETLPINYPPMPHAIFSYPQIAGVGVTEDELLAQGKKEGEDYIVALQNYKNSAMGMAMRPEVGLVKLIADKKTRKLIGAHIVGEKSSDIIHMLIAYMTMNATADQLLEMIYIHPALSEVIRNAARKLVASLSR